jgi:hypothetical protein
MINNNNVDLKNNDDEDLKNIFIDNKTNYCNIKFIVFSLPKSGSSTIYNSLKNKFGDIYGILHFHSIIELKNIDERFGKYTLFQIISFIEKYNKYEKIYIFSSYRIPTERFISFFYHNNNVHKLDRDLNKYMDLKSIFNLTNLTGDELSAFQVVFTDLYEKEFNIDFNKLDYDVKKGYCKFDYSEKITWIFTYLPDMEKCFRNLKDIDEIFENIKLQHSNENSSEKYVNMKNKIKFDQECLDYFYSKEKKIINFYKLL